MRVGAAPLAAAFRVIQQSCLVLFFHPKRHQKYANFLLQAPVFYPQGINQNAVVYEVNSPFFICIVLAGQRVGKGAKGHYFRKERVHAKGLFPDHGANGLFFFL
ncbi:hypothetical protein [Chitinophaga alhagiae]|uniref:hypothetical protein n=1 Tax=Chitinophaga alhagiae TaxID=2203219 RepID=UPI001300A887|nr:hypothetical protein [Chitinophaga alhagiae]